MATKKALMFGAAALAAASFQANAQELLAYVSTPLPAGTQTLVSVPVNNAVEIELEIDSIVGSTQLNFTGSPLVDSAYNAGNFAKFYVRFIDGGAAGLWSSITVNSASSITIDNNAVGALAGGGDTVRVYAHHTVGSVFPANMLDDADGGILTEGVVTNGLQIQFYSTSDAIDKGQGSGTPSFATYLSFGGGTGIWDLPDLPLLPESSFIISNPSANDLVYIAPGSAPDHAVSYLIKGGVASDTFLGTGYPVDLTVLSTGLGSGVANRQIFTRGTGVNQAPGSNGGTSFSYLGFLGIWDLPSETIDPFAGFFLRTDATDAGGKVTVVKPY